MKHKIASTLIMLAVAATSYGQLIFNNQATTGVASALQSESAALLGYAETSQPNFTAAGLEFSLIPNYELGEIVVGSGELGSFFANVSFLGRESLRPNHFGVSDDSLGGFGTGGSTLFLDYTTADFVLTKNITAATYTEANFWHYADKPSYSGTFFMDETLSFRTWEAIDVDANRIYTIFGIDDLRSAFIDFDDGLFLIERNLDPVAIDDQDFTPVPEPSAYALIGALVLLTAIYFRANKRGSVQVLV